MSQIKKQYPGLDIRMFFMNEAVKIPPAKVTTYGDWAKKTGYEYYTFSKDINFEHNKEQSVPSDSSNGASDGKSSKRTSRKTPVYRAQPDGTSGRSRRTKDGSIQKEKGETKPSRRGSRRSLHGNKDGGR